jgi:hypothetical protein
MNGFSHSRSPAATCTARRTATPPITYPYGTAVPCVAAVRQMEGSAARNVPPLCRGIAITARPVSMDQPDRHSTQRSW